jgi:DNA-directed RNA polymerase subunit RPC12/RpoP
MAKSVSCPKCAASLDGVSLTPEGEFVCPSCGGRFRMKPRPAAGPASEPRTSPPPPQAEADPTPKKKKGGGKRKKTRADAPGGPRRLRTWALIGGGALVGLVAVGLTIWALSNPGGDGRPKRDPAGDKGGKGRPGDDFALRKAAVVLDKPLADVAALPVHLRPMPVLPRFPAAVATLRPAQTSDALAGGAVGWAARPDPPKGKPVAYPDTVLLYGRNEVAPVLASCGGPFALLYEVSRASKPDRPELGIEGEPARGEAPMPVTDLRTGKPAGRFAWNAPAWARARLSPDAEHLIGPDNREKCLITTKEGKLFIWKREQPRPVGTITVPGPVLWLDFVSETTVAILTFAETPVLQFWDVAARKLTASAPLPADELVRPNMDPNGLSKPQAGDKTYAPDPWRGAVSPGRGFVALAGARKVLLVSVAGAKLAGSIPLPTDLAPGRTAKDFTPRGLAFSPDGAELWAMSRPNTDQRHHDLVWLLTWSMATGAPDRTLALAEPGFLGPPLPGPEPGTLLIPYQEFGQRDAKQMMHYEGRPLSPGSVVDAGTGATLYAHQCLPLRAAGDRVVAFTVLKLLPGAPLPATHAAANPADAARFREQLRAVHLTKVRPSDGAVARKKPGPARPKVGPGDRSAVARRKAEPPEKWARPPAPPPPPQGLLAAVHVPGSRPLWGETTVGFLSSYAELMNTRLIAELWPRARTGDKAAAKKLEELYKIPEGIHWHRYDLRTGRRLGPSVPLWPWATSAVAGIAFNFHQDHAAAAMKADGSMVALRDPADRTRVDCWDASGKRVAGFFPYDRKTPVDWVGWSKGGRLLTLGGGRLAAWEPGQAKAVYELDGGYAPPIATIRGDGWLVVAAGAHLDVVDADTGKCLGRCRLPAGAYDPARPYDLALAPDGSLLACLAWQKKMTPDGIGILFGWDLTTGQALDPLPTERVPGRTPVMLDGRRILFDGGQLCDVRTQMEWGWFNPPPFNLLPSDLCADGPLVGSPDGRVWAFGPEPTAEAPAKHRAAEVLSLRPLELPGHDSGTTNPAEVFSTRAPLRVEVDVGEAGASRRRAEAIVRHLQGKGFTIGPKGWTLRVWVEVRDGKGFLQYKGGIGTVNVPEVVTEFRLISPTGEVALSFSDMAAFGVNTRYFKGVKVVPREGLRGAEEHTWDFRDKSPRQAMIEEMLELARGSGAGRLLLPARLAKVRGRYQSGLNMTTAVFPPVILPKSR